MTLSVGVIKEKSTDPNFTLNVSIYDSTVSVTNVQVEVQRISPKVSIRYPEEIQNVLPQIDQKKLELEILNKVVEHIMQTTENNVIKTNAFFGRKV